MKLVDGSPKEIPASDVFSGKRVVVCGVPGALTPTCNEQVSSNILVELCRDLYSGHMLMYTSTVLNNCSTFLGSSAIWISSNRRLVSR